MKKGFRSGGRMLVLLGAALLAACGGEASVADEARPVWVVQPQGGAGAGELAFPGEVRAREESPLAFRVGGKLVRRLVDAGARVSEGQVLAELDPQDQALQAQAAQAQLAAATAERVRLQGDLERYRALVGQQLVSQSAFDAQKAAYEAAAGQERAARAQWDVSRNQSDYTALRAPAAGVIASREAEAGQVVAAGQTVFTLAVDGGREVAIHLPEDRIGTFQVGQPALIEIWGQPGERVPGTVRELAAAADPQTRSYPARIAFDDPAQAGQALGRSARVYLAQARGGAGTLSVPLGAVQRGDDGHATVWVVRLGRVSPVPVTVGTYGSSSVPIVGGLTGEDWVVAAGGHLLRADQAVNPVDRDNRPVAAAAASARAD